MLSKSEQVFQISNKERAAMQLALLSIEEPTEENIGKFNEWSKFFTSGCEKFDQSEFNYRLEKYIGIYNDSNKDAIWRMLSANAIFEMYISTIPRSGLPLDNPHLVECIKWAQTVIEMPELNHPLDTQAKTDACMWLAALYERRKKFELSLEYYEKSAKIIKSAPNSKYSDISSVLIKIAQIRANILPETAALADNETQLLIRALDQVVQFHSNVTNDKKTMEKVGPKSQWAPAESQDAAKMVDKAERLLSFLYEKILKANISNPQKAAIELDIATVGRTNNKYITALLNKPEIKKAREEVETRFKSSIERTYNNLVELTDHYLNNLNRGEIDPAKGNIFINLQVILNNPGESKYKCILLFEKALNDINQEILCTHRTATLERYLVNALSFLTVIPAIVRAIDSYSKYGTLRFWKPESQQAFEYAKENCEDLDHEIQSILVR